MKKTYCTRLNFPWNSEKRFFRKIVNFNKFWREPECVRCYEVEYIRTIILNRCDWMKNEENILYTLWYPWNPEKHFFASTSTSINFGARQSARDVMTLSTSQILFDIEQVYISNPCDWMKVEENIYAIMFLKIMKKWLFSGKLQF